MKPSNNRPWTPDNSLLPQISNQGNLYTIKNVRNYSYRTTDDYDVGYYDATYDLEQLEKVYFVVEPFAGYQGAAHTLMSFGFKNGNYLAVSVELRKEVGESFSPWRGILRGYEIVYVIADERDVVKLRSNYRHDDVFVYPIKTTPEKARALFASMMLRANETANNPEFYHTVFNNCTTNIADHVNRISTRNIPWTWTQLFPANSDKTVYDMGLIDTDLSFDDARKKFHINERATKFADSPDFSRKIRE